LAIVTAEISLSLVKDLFFDADQIAQGSRTVSGSLNRTVDIYNRLACLATDEVCDDRLSAHGCLVPKRCQVNERSLRKLSLPRLGCRGKEVPRGARCAISANF
jgi:hypothetical protein